MDAELRKHGRGESEGLDELMISQSSTIAFFLLAGFVIYVTMKGELPQYAAILGIGNAGSGQAATPTLAQQQSNQPTSGSLGSYLPGFFAPTGIPPIE